MMRATMLILALAGNAASFVVPRPKWRQSVAKRASTLETNSGETVVETDSDDADYTLTPVGPANPSGPPGYPNVIIYPNPGWGLSKPKPKQSLDEVGTSGSAAPWILNVIELAHWVSFPIGFKLFWTMTSNLDKLGKAIRPGAPLFAFFCLQFAHVSQVYGGGISGNMMHQYEGWQVAPFRNPLKPGEVEAGHNDAWLRAVAYQMLFSFQTLGVLLTWVGVRGASSLFAKFVVGLSAFVVTMAPQLPHCTSVFPTAMKKIGLGKFWTWLTRGNRPVFPLSVWLFGGFMVNSILATLAYVKMFGAISWKGVWLMDVLPSAVTALIPFALIALGGIYEGLRAETTFNQWDHLIAFIMLDAGLALHIPYYLRLIA